MRLILYNILNQYAYWALRDSGGMRYMEKKKTIVLLVTHDIDKLHIMV